MPQKESFAAPEKNDANGNIELSFGDICMLIWATYRLTSLYLLLFIVIMWALAYLLTEKPIMIPILLGLITFSWLGWALAGHIVGDVTPSDTSTKD